MTPQPSLPPLLYLGSEEVERLLPMGECIALMEQALRDLALGAAVQPLRSVMRLDGRPGLLGVMPGQIQLPADARPSGSVAGVKVVSIFPGNRERGDESHFGAVLLFETETGRPIAHLDAAAITAIRTAAVSAVATRLLARDDAGELALLGAGVQARSHLAALREVRELRRVRVWSRRPESAQRFAAEEGARHRLAIDMMGGGEVLDREAQRLEEGDLGGRAAAGEAAEQQVADLPLDVVLGDDAFAQREEEVARFVDRRFAAVDEQAGAGDRRAVELARRRDAGADRIDVDARREPLAGEHRLARCGHGAHQVGAGDRRRRRGRRLDRQAVAGALLGGKAPGALRPAAAPPAEAIPARAPVEELRSL